MGSPQIRQLDLRLALRLAHFEQRLYIFRAKSCVTTALRPRMPTKTTALRRVSFMLGPYLNELAKPFPKFVPYTAESG